MSLVGEMPPDKEIDICPLTLPALTLSFDQLCMDRAALRQVNFEHNLKIIEWLKLPCRYHALQLKKVMLPGRPGLGVVNFPFWKTRVDTAGFTKTAKVSILLWSKCATLQILLFITACSTPLLLQHCSTNILYGDAQSLGRVWKCSRLRNRPSWYFFSRTG